MVVRYDPTSMVITETELRQRLLGDDDEQAEQALRQHFVPVARRGLGFSWCPAPGLEPEHDDESWRERWVQRMIDLANGAERRLRDRRYRWRLRRRPQWPIILSEGDSWVAHPFIHDLSDRLSDEDHHAFNVLCRGAGGDLLADMEREREQETALREAEARALVLSGGGNDMLAGFEDLLTAERGDAEPVEWILEVLQPHLDEAMCTMARVLEGVRGIDERIPVVVHGYDYLRVGERGKGRFLAPFFDELGLDDRAVRAGAIRGLVDRFNEGLQRVAERMERVRYVDLRGVVPDGEWEDEIHPDRRGFSRLGDRLAAVLLDEIG